MAASMGDSILFSAVQSRGKKVRQEDFFINSNDECIVLSDGGDALPHGDIASRLACETAVWAYAHSKPLNTYRYDRKELLKRIFRSTNITLWQKQREVEFKDGMAATLTVAMIGTRTVWIGSIGDTAAYFWHGGLVKKITRDDCDAKGILIKNIGSKRYDVIPQMYTLDFTEGDMVLLATGGFSRFVPEQEMTRILSSTGATLESMTETVVFLLQTAEKNGSEDNMTACLLKRIQN